MLLTFNSCDKDGKESTTPDTPLSTDLSHLSSSGTPTAFPVFRQHEAGLKKSAVLKKRSKGCITCKVRKKGCDQMRPVCGSCARLNRVCKYREDGMTEEDVRRTKEKLRLLEEDAKKSKRRKPNASPSARENPVKSEQKPKKVQQIDAISQESRVVFNPLSPSFINYFSRDDTPTSFNLMDTPSGASSLSHLPINHYGENFNSREYNNTDPSGSTHAPKSQIHMDGVKTIASPSQDYLSLEESLTPDFSIFREMAPEFAKAFQNALIYEPVLSHQNSPQIEEVSEVPVHDIYPTNPEPKIYHAPSMVQSTTLSTLGPLGRRLFAYYRDHLAVQISTVPNEENLFLTSFLPMAHCDFGVLYGILGWSAFRIGGESMEKKGTFFISKALDYMRASPILVDDEKDPNYLADVKQTIDLNEEEEQELANESNEKRALELSKTAEKFALRDRIDMRFASYLIMIGAEVCRGDVTNWFKYLEYGAKLIKHSGGVYEYGRESRDRHFLVSSYAYHDMQSSSVNERSLHFSIEDYDSVWDFFDFGIDALHGLSKPLYGLIAKINELSMKSRIMMKKVTSSIQKKSQSPTATSPLDDKSSSSSVDFYANQLSQFDEAEQALFQTRYEVLKWVHDKSRELDKSLEEAKPNLNNIMGLSSKELELQLTLFEIFQLTAKIHLNQSVNKVNQSCLEIQYLNTQLIERLDVVLGTPVECCLCFPLFIAGMNCITERDRDLMRSRFENLKRRYSWKNVDRAEIIMLKFWELNPTGERFVDWYGIVKDLGWDLSFA
ncbi:unnamed protein product [Kuraishia capsulata CBS 1993]|uniref:Zn(2)-C6 fungal-type domain-containing protein n=1 Tax=Kuraishia capsulata CBS 1993 TaxID=1382522 RepID=W6MFU6_9ASCO|nr:uncharacterized protein KUCA_T00000459001 [Kuraishia capsulata CBS 1993]CDK24496.1 unnamed protein product [Kuraishia capsulata CBS 1993]